MASPGWLTYCLFVLLASQASAQEVDPLPAGAVKRLGTARLRHPGEPRVQFVQGDKAILSAGPDETVRLWDAKTGQELRRFAGSKFSLSSDENILATSGTAIRVWDMTTGKEFACSPLDHGSKPVLNCQIAFSRDKKSLVAMILFDEFVDGQQRSINKVHTWDLKSGHLTHHWRITDGSRYDFLSPQATIVVTTPGSAGFKLRNASTGTLLHDWPFTHYGRSIFAPDGQTMVALMLDEQEKDSKGGSLVGRDLKSGKDRFRIRISSPTSSPWNWYFSPDGKRLATAPALIGRDSHADFEKKSMRIVEVATGKTLHELPVDEGGFHHVIFSADNTRLAIAESCDRICIWNLETGKKVRDIACPTWRYRSFDLSPDGKTLAASVGPCIHLWDTDSGKRLLRQQAHERSPIVLTFSGDGKTIASMDSDAVTKVWDSKTGRQIDHLAAPVGDAQHVHPFAAPLLSFNPQGKVQALGVSMNRWFRKEVFLTLMVHQADLAAQKLMRSYGNYQTPIDCFALSGDGKTLAGVLGRHLHLWNTASGKERFAIAWCDEIPKAQANQYDPPRPPVLAFSPDGRIIASRSFRQIAPDRLLATINLWEVATGKVRHRLEGELPPTDWAGGGRQGPITAVFDWYGGSLVLAPDGKRVALGYGDTIRLWDIAQNREIRRFGGHVQTEHATFSPDGKYLAAVGSDGSIFLWDVATGTRLQSIKTAGRFTCFRFAPDGCTLATGGNDTAIMLWNLAHFTTPAKAEAAPANLDALWNALASDDGIKAGNAILALGRSDAAGVRFLKGKLPPIAPVDAKRLRKLHADLDDGNFSVRDQARRDLEALGDLALPVLRKDDGTKLSLESQRRVEALLAKLESAAPTTEELRGLRAIEALEHIGSAEARQVLEALAAGAPEHRVTIAAAEAGKRLGLRQEP